MHLLTEGAVDRKTTRLSLVKVFIVFEGSMTGIGVCTDCASAASEYINARKNFFDYAAKWINDKF